MFIVFNFNHRCCLLAYYFVFLFFYLSNCWCFHKYPGTVKSRLQALGLYTFLRGFGWAYNRGAYSQGAYYFECINSYNDNYILCFRAIFNWVSQVIRDCIGFALLRSVIGLENSHHPLNQSDAKLKPIAKWLLAFSRASGQLHVFTLSSHWLLVILTFVLIGRCDYFGFGFTTLNWKVLYVWVFILMNHGNLERGLISAGAYNRSLLTDGPISWGRYDRDIR